MRQRVVLGGDEHHPTSWPCCGVGRAPRLPTTASARASGPAPRRPLQLTPKASLRGDALPRPAGGTRPSRGGPAAAGRRPPVATLPVLDQDLIDRFSIEGYQGGTGYFDDAYVRSYATPEPTVLVGAAGAPNSIAMDATAVVALTMANPCAAAVPVTITCTDTTPVRGYRSPSTRPELALCGSRGGAFSRARTWTASAPAPSSRYRQPGRDLHDR